MNTILLSADAVNTRVPYIPMQNTGVDTMTIKDLGRWESIQMVVRYTRSMRFEESLKLYHRLGVSIFLSQARTMPKQAGTMPAQVSAAQTNGLDITAILNLMIPVMIMGLMMKMMTGAMSA